MMKLPLSSELPGRQGGALSYSPILPAMAVWGWLFSGIKDQAIYAQIHLYPGGDALEFVALADNIKAAHAVLTYNANCADSRTSLTSIELSQASMYSMRNEHNVRI